MIVYQSTKSGFLNDASNGIEDIVRERVKEKLNLDIKVGSSEYNSWKNSLGDAMYKVMQTDKIPNDSCVAIEYAIPRAKNRIDFIITGEDEDGKEKVVIIELKQWTDIQKTDKDGVVLTHFKSGQSEEPHPSYQAWSYSALLYGFNATVYEEKIGLEPCAYLHNHVDNEVILSPFYGEYLEKAPAFCKGDKEKLQDFISKFVKHGERKNTLFRIDNGEIRPSKNLADSLSSMLKGNLEFVLIDEQKIVYETALSLTKKSSEENKNVLIVEGGPGTGKSVVAINLLVAITKLGLNTQYVTKNAAPRGVFEAKLVGSFKKSEISNFFTGSGSFVEEEKNIFDALIVDEAHRLNEKSGMFKNLGENQIKEIIDSAKCSIFFIDEDQKVTWHDIGKKEEIEKWANKIGAKVQSLKLESQFRCNGSDGYLSWLDNILGIEDTANTTLEGIDYDFKIVDSPNELRDLIFDKNKIDNKARLVAGYCWDWVSKKDKNLNDIVFPEYDFGMKWNLASDGNVWIISPKSVNEIGCIHTCQGLEVDYVGVIVGDDFIVRNGEIITNPDKRAKTDASLKGYRKELKIDLESTIKKAEEIIKNTYRTLMTRGMKGCYVYFVDKETEKYFKSRIVGTKPPAIAVPQRIISPYTIEMVRIPLVGSAPCGNPLLGEENIEEYIEVEKSKIKPGAKYFIVRASGDSMNQAGINDEDLVLCRYSEKGETGDKVVALLGGENVTIKYYDKKDGHRILLPKSTNPVHKPIIPEEGDMVQGIVQEVIKDASENLEK
ncbi:MAG: DNA/RNA helicase domain-containing protein [Minisyncoccota bacterium]